MPQRPRHHLAPPQRRYRDGRGVLLSAVTLLWLAAGCSAPRHDRDVVHAAGADEKVKLELSSGPIEELVVVRDTDRRFVVSGLCYFPDGTWLSVALYDSSGALLARTVPTIDRALFRSLPLGDQAGGGWPAGRYAVELSAEFAPGAQPPAVLHAFGSGRDFRGDGMTKSRQGRPAYSRRFQVRL
jgi:hypothetical protein